MNLSTSLFYDHHFSYIRTRINIDLSLNYNKDYKYYNRYYHRLYWVNKLSDTCWNINRAVRG